MIRIRKAKDRGHAQHGWLDSYHTFSFGEYHDPDYMGFSVLRVINQDRVEPGKGFGKHPHKNMEIISYVLEGALAHEDSTGSGSVILPGDVQRMSAGTGVTHSEFNHSANQPVHFLQIWILPAETNIPPSYEQKTFPSSEKANYLKLIASPTGQNGSLTLHQDVNVFAAILEARKSLTYSLTHHRKGWVQVIKGEITVNGSRLLPGDGAAIETEPEIQFSANALSEFLFFDLP